MKESNFDFSKTIFRNSQKNVLGLLYYAIIFVGLVFLSGCYFLFFPVELNFFLKIATILVAVIVILLLVIVYFNIKKIFIDYVKATSNFNAILEGENEKNDKFKSQWSEINLLDALILKVNTTHNQLFDLFDRLEKKDFSYNFEANDENDKLFLSANKMALRLKEIAEKDDQMNWFNQGLTLFSETLRQQNVDLKSLSNEILSKLIKYIGANQAKIYFLKEEKTENAHLELYATYAFDKKKYGEQNIKLYFENGNYRHSEGLVGQTFIEKETIYLTDIPDNYIEITSGLGHANPRNIVIVPLKLNENIVGIVEIASFKVLEPYKVSFVEKLGEMVSATYISMESNFKTKKLLDETQQQTFMLRERDEEMTQNLEEMSAIQEDLERSQNELITLKQNLELEVIKQTAQIVLQLKKLEESEQIALRKEKQVIAILNGIEYGIFLADQDGNILIANEACFDTFCCKSSEISELNYNDLFPELEKIKFRKPLKTTLKNRNQLTEKVELTVNKMGFEGNSVLLFFIKNNKTHP